MPRSIIKIVSSLTTLMCTMSALTPMTKASSSPGWCIEVVHPGDSLYQISKQYHTTPQKIRDLNGLESTSIVPGQALIIQSDQLFVHPGDSLYSIAIRHGQTVQNLITANPQVKKHGLVAGSRLNMPHLPRYSLTVGAFFVPTGNQAKDKQLLAHYSYARYMGLFEDHIATNGSLVTRSFGVATSVIRQNGSNPSIVITNLTSSGFNGDYMHDILSTPSKRDTLVDSIWELLRANQFRYVMLDIEELNPQDRAWFNQFLKQLHTKLSPSGMKIFISVPPKQGDYTPSYASAYDYRTIGKYVDSMFLMAYDWHLPGVTGPGPIAPYPNVKATVAYATSVVPRQKLGLGIPLYAYDWNVTTGQGLAISEQTATNEAVSHQSTIHFDNNSRSSYFSYGLNGARHVVWFEDARSLAADYKLLTTYRLGNVGGWQINWTFPQAETMMGLTLQAT